MDSISKKFLLMDNLAKAMEPLDTRVQGMVQHSTSAIFLITLAGVFAKCQTWNEIADYGKIKIDFFRRFIPELESTPSHDTFRRFFSIIDPDKLESLYRGWAYSLADSNSSLTESSTPIKRHIAIDGKRMRSAGKENLAILSSIVDEINNDHNYDSKAHVHIVSAYDVINEVSLGQERVPEKSNEITADKALIE